MESVEKCDLKLFIILWDQSVPSPRIAEWWTKRSADPSAGVMNPYPLLLNHLQVPVADIFQWIVFAKRESVLISKYDSLYFTIIWYTSFLISVLWWSTKIHFKNNVVLKPLD